MKHFVQCPHCKYTLPWDDHKGIALFGEEHLTLNQFVTYHSRDAQCSTAVPFIGKVGVDAP